MASSATSFPNTSRLYFLAMSLAIYLYCKVQQLHRWSDVGPSHKNSATVVGHAACIYSFS